MLYWVPLQKTSLEGALWFGNYCSTPSQSILLRLLRGLKDVLLRNVQAHVIRPRFLISISLLMILTHACLSCCNNHSRQFYLGKLLQLEIFAWIAAAALKERGGWSVCHFGVGQKKRNQSCSLIRFFLVFGWGGEPYYSANKCKHWTSIDQTQGGQWKPINYGYWSYLGCPK